MITLHNAYAGMTKEVKEGFSWTVLFFRMLVPLMCGDWLWFLIMLVAAFVTSGFTWLVFPFIYNKIYINNLMEKGYSRTS